MRRLLPLYLVIFVGFIAYSIQIPIFTSLFLEHGYGPDIYPDAPYDTRRFVLGLLLSMYPLGQFLGSPVIGAFSDRFGRKKLLLFSLIMTILCTAAAALCIQYVQIFLLHVFLFLAGLFEGNIAIAQGAIVDCVDDSNRSRYFGYIYVCSSLGFIAGPILASFFSNPNFVSWFAPATSFWIVSGFMVILTVWIFFHFHETHADNGHHKRGFFQEFTNLSHVFSDRNLRYYYGINFLIYFAIFGFLRIYPTFITVKFNIDFGFLAIIVAYVSLPFVCVNLLLTPLFSKLKAPKEITLVFSILMGLSMISIVLFPQFNALWFTLAITTFCLAIVNTFSAAMISFMTDKDHQGSVMGNNQSLVSGAQGVSAIVGGALALIAAFVPLVFFGLLAIFAGIMLLKRKQAQWQRDHFRHSSPAVIDDDKDH